MNLTEIKKELYKSKANAKLSHYTKGKLYYTIELSDGVYMFPIAIVEQENRTLKLSSDLGDTPFGVEEKGSYLIRWIAKAIESNDFIQIKKLEAL